MKSRKVNRYELVEEIEKNSIEIEAKGERTVTDSVKNPGKTKGKPRGKSFKQGNPGRPKGALGKFTRIKDVYLTVFNEGDGGVAFWRKIREKYPLEFAQMGCRMVPREVDVKAEVDLNMGIVLLPARKGMEPNGSHSRDCQTEEHPHTGH